MATNVKKDITDVIVNTDVMADLFGFTRQRINQLAKDGVLEKQAPGRFLLRQNIKKYLDYIHFNQLDEDEDGATAQYWEEKALHEKAKRELSEMKLAKQRNQLHDATDVELLLTGMLVTFRNRILGIPQKVAPKVIGVNTLAEIGDTIARELLEVLTELSEYDPVLFAGGEPIEEEDDETISPDTEVGSPAS